MQVKWWTRKGKQLRVVLVCVFVVSILLCPAAISFAKKTEIWMSFFGEDPPGAQVKLMELFEKRHPDIDVKWWKMPPTVSERYTKYATILMARQGEPDILNLDVIWPPAMASAGWLEALDKWFPSEEQIKFNPAQIEHVTYKEHVWAVPWHMDGGSLYYRKDLLSDAGFEAPRTWMELVHQVKAIQNMTKESLMGLGYAFARHEGLVCYFLEFLGGNNGKIVNENGQVVINSKAGVEALQMMLDLIFKYEVLPPGVRGYKGDDTRKLFQDGRLILNRGWGYCWGRFESEDSAVKGKVAIAPIPHFVGGKSVSNIGGWNFAINVYSGHKKEAWEVIEFFTSYETQKIRVLMGGETPARKALFLEDKEVLAKYPQYPQFYDAYQNGVARPVHPRYPEISDVMQTELHAALMQEKSPKEALDSLAKKLEPYFK